MVDKTGICITFRRQNIKTFTKPEYRTHTPPNSTFLYASCRLMDLMTWDVTGQIELNNQPLLIMAVSKAGTKYMAGEAFRSATNAKASNYSINQATHIRTCKIYNDEF